MRNLLRVMVVAAIALSVCCNKPFGPLHHEHTEHLSVSNETNEFSRSADQYDYHGTETYTWHNCGEAAMVEGSAVPSCSNCVHVRIYDAVGTQVLDTTFHAPHCFHSKTTWDPEPTSTGVPGDWRIELEFDISEAKDVNIRVYGVEPTRLNATTGTETYGEEGQHTRTFVRMTAECTNDRNVDESHPLKVACNTASVHVSWGTLTEGSMTLIVTDGAGTEVYRHTFAPGDATPFDDVTAEGTPGEWTVRLEAHDLTSTQLLVQVTSP